MKTEKRMVFILMAWLREKDEDGEINWSFSYSINHIKMARPLRPHFSNLILEVGNVG